MNDWKKEHTELHYNTLRYLFTSINKIRDVKVMVETGIASGQSGKVMLESCPKATYYGYDLWLGYDEVNEKPARALLESFERVNIQKINTQTLEKFPDNVDLIYVDGDHSTLGCLHDLELVEKHLSPEGIIVVHDMDHVPIQEAIKIWNKDERFGSFEIKFGRGYGVFWRKEK